jgi:quinol-cytochrome oxidoreductase complex cytochrome b subunit
VSVGTNIAGYVPVLGQEVREFLLGGPEVGQSALLRFYVLHIYVLPASLIVLLAVHIWRVRKDGFAVPVVVREQDAQAP